MGKLEISIREGTKGCGDERGGSLRRFIAAFSFFFFGSFFRSIYCVLGNEKLNRREKSYKIEIVGLINF